MLRLQESDAEDDGSLSDLSDSVLLKKAPQSTPRRQRRTFLSATGSTASEEEAVQEQRPLHTGLERVNLPFARSAALSSSLHPPGEAVSTSSSTLVDSMEQVDNFKASASPLSRALAATKLPKTLSPPSVASTELPAPVQPLSSTPRRARLSLSPPVASSSAISPPSSGAAARERIRRIFENVQTIDDSPLPPKRAFAARNGEPSSPVRPSTTARDRARMQRQLGLSTGDRGKPAVIAEQDMSSRATTMRQRDVTRSKASRLHDSDIEEADDEAPMSSMSALKTPHPPGHLSFHGETPLRGPALSRARFVRPAADDVADIEGDSAQFVNPRSPPVTPPRVSKDKGKGRERSSSTLSPRKAVAKGIALFAQLRETLDEEAAVFKRDEHRFIADGERAKALRLREKELRTKLARASRVIDDGSETSSDSQGLERASLGRVWPYVATGALVLCSLAYLIFTYAEAHYQHAYFDGMVPPSIYAPLDHLNDYATKATLHAFGTKERADSLRLLMLSTRRSLTTRLLRIVEMPPYGFRVPT